MRRVAKFVIMLSASIFSVLTASAWGKEGHCTIGHIADRNLTPKAQKLCNKYLGHSLAYYGSWMDKWRYSKEYHHTARWHSVGIIDGEFVPCDMAGSKAYYEAAPTMDDHGVARLEQLIEQTRNYRKLSDSAVVVNLKCIIHMVGDLHCPGHIFRNERVQYSIYNGGKKAHSHDFIDNIYTRYNRGKSSDEFYDRACRLNKEEIAEICEGDMAKWVLANEPLVNECYRLLPKGAEYTELPEQNYFRLKEIMDELHRNAGFRLAYIINQIFR